VSAEGEVCITCGDRALPLRVVAPGAEPGLARCADAEGREEEVEVSLLAPVAVGERLLVHAGAAIARVEEEQT
jgi:hydrogenase maturation factor